MKAWEWGGGWDRATVLKDFKNYPVRMFYVVHWLFFPKVIA